MPDDLSLFDDDEPSELPQPARPETPIADWQVELLRKSLDSRGLAEMAERRDAIEAAAGRPVESLRALTHEEALTVLSRLGSLPAPARRAGSLWDDRDEDTWIDRM